VTHPFRNCSSLSSRSCREVVFPLTSPSVPFIPLGSTRLAATLSLSFGASRTVSLRRTPTAPRRGSLGILTSGKTRARFITSRFAESRIGSRFPRISLNRHCRAALRISHLVSEGSQTRAPRGREREREYNGPFPCGLLIRGPRLHMYVHASARRRTKRDISLARSRRAL